MSIDEELLVLYQGKGGQTWGLYAGGREEAAREFHLMGESDDTLEEVGRIVIKKTAVVELFTV
jgi:hypothetical protein